MANGKEKEQRRTAAIGGHGPPSAVVGGQAPPTSSVTTKEAVVLFMEAGFPRSLRSVERYCKKGKLEAFLHPDEDTYYIPIESVETLIGQFRETQERRVNRPPTDVATGPPTSDDSGGHGPPMTASGGKEVEKLEAELEDVTNERNSALIDAQARQIVINQMVKQIQDDREQYMSIIEGNALLVGELKQKLLQIEGPRDAGGEGKSPPPPEGGGENVEEESASI